MSKILYRKTLIFLSLIVISFSLYMNYSTLNYYFFQDDFFHLVISKANNIKEFFDFFKFRNDIIGYRPITIQLYFFSNFSLFGLNTLNFRIVNLVFLFASYFLLIKIIEKITQDKFVGFLTATLWILSSIHFMTIIWISASYLLIGTFFWLLTSLFFIKFQKERKNIFYILSLISFLLTIGSFEFSITWPVIFGFYYFYVLKNTLYKSIKVFSPFFLLTTIYLLLRIFLIKVPQILEYKIAFNLESAKALFWYLLWSFNIPEEFKKQIVNNLVIFNPKFFSEYWPLILKSFTGFFLILLVSVILPIFYIIKKHLKINLKIIIFGIYYFLVAILPVLFLPNHTFSMYLALPSIGIYFLLAYFVASLKSKTLAISLVLIWLATSVTTLSFYKTNSWMIESQRFSRDFSLGMKKQFPRLPQNSIILYQLNDPRYKQALLESNAARALYNDPTISIYYNKEDLLSSLRSLSLDQLGTAGLKENLSDDKIRNKPVFIYIPE